MDLAAIDSATPLPAPPATSLSSRVTKPSRAFASSSSCGRSSGCKNGLLSTLSPSSAATYRAGGKARSHSSLPQADKTARMREEDATCPRGAPPRSSFGIVKRASPRPSDTL